MAVFSQARAVFAQDVVEPLSVRAGAFRFRADAYVQAQYERHAESENELSSDGRRLLNGDRFDVRRARIAGVIEHRWMEGLIELDANTAQGPSVGVRRVEASLRWPGEPGSPAPLMLTFGLFRTPFGHEVLQSPRERVFMENSTVAQAFFPGESDAGARVQGSVRWFRYALAVVNGHPIDEPRFGGQAPIAPQDLVGRLGVAVARPRFRIEAGVSGLGGTGFHPGSPQGVDTLGVRDTNESGVLQPDSLTLMQGRAQVPSLTFPRFAAGFDVTASVDVSPMWRMEGYVEGVFGQNMDRGLFVSDPVLNGHDVRALGFVAGLWATVARWGLAGARVDHYDPDVDSTGRVGGRVTAVPMSITTVSLLGGVRIPGTATRLVAQYDFIQDHLALGTDGLPTDRRNDRFTLRLQVAPW